MALTFTDWEHWTDTETGETGVLDWTSAETLANGPLRPAFDAVRQAMNERLIEDHDITVYEKQIASTEKNSPALWHPPDVLASFTYDDAVGSLLLYPGHAGPWMNPSLTMEGAASGYWPSWTQETMLAAIGDTEWISFWPLARNSLAASTYLLQLKKICQQCYLTMGEYRVSGEFTTYVSQDAKGGYWGSDFSGALVSYNASAIQHSAGYTNSLSDSCMIAYHDVYYNAPQFCPIWKMNTVWTLPVRDSKAYTYEAYTIMESGGTSYLNNDYPDYPLGVFHLCDSSATPQSGPLTTGLNPPPTWDFTLSDPGMGNSIGWQAHGLRVLKNFKVPGGFVFQ